MREYQDVTIHHWGRIDISLRGESLHTAHIKFLVGGQKSIYAYNQTLKIPKNASILPQGHTSPVLAAVPPRHEVSESSLQ
jgi:hypothetical protein